VSGGRKSLGLGIKTTQEKEFDVGKEYEIKKQIGKGSYGKVCEAMHIPTG
jgi:serine/threonine protein kinase